MITDKKEQRFAKRILSRIAVWEEKRRQKFKEELLKIPEFVDALFAHKDEYLKQMKEDNELFVKKFGFPLNLEKINREMTINYKQYCHSEGLQKYPRTDIVDANLWAGDPFSPKG